MPLDLLPLEEGDTVWETPTCHKQELHFLNRDTNKIITVILE